jgi:hypothetical protein
MNKKILILDNREENINATKEYFNNKITKYRSTTYISAEKKAINDIKDRAKKGFVFATLYNNPKPI